MKTSQWSENTSNAITPTIFDSLRSRAARKISFAALLGGIALPAIHPKAQTLEAPDQGAIRQMAQQKNSLVGEPQTVNGVQGLIEKWNPQHNLYISGSLKDIGISQAKANELALWLKNYPHWTVFLISRSEGQHYTDREGRTFRNREAIEHAAGKELPNTTAFGSLKDPVTGLENGVFLYISFDSNATH